MTGQPEGQRTVSKDVCRPVQPPAGAGSIDGAVTRRRSRRVAGPFDGYRLGALDVPVRIHDLSDGGCLFESHTDVAIGRRITLKIDLPGEGWITVPGETLYVRESYWFAVKFIEVDEANRGRIERTVERLLDRSAEDDWRVDEVKN
jgi:hypothetical protein